MHSFTALLHTHFGTRNVLFYLKVNSQNLKIRFYGASEAKEVELWKPSGRLSQGDEF